MTPTNRTRSLSLVAFAFAAGLAGCGGGGGAAPGNPPIGPTACPAGYTGSPPNCVPAVTQAQAGGKVVDYDSNAPLANEPVAVAPYTAGATATQVATTAADGSFAFSIAPGTYLLQIGSNSAAPSDNRATVHAKIALVAGTNVLTAPTPPSEPQVAYVASQLSPNFRLMALSPDETDCLTGMNAGRTAHALPTVVPDELLEENARMIVLAQFTAKNYTVPVNYVSGFVRVGANFTPCSAWTNTYSFTPGASPYVVATNASTIWYGASLLHAQSGQYTTYSAQEWQTDPRM